jgi:hypothetical protein
MLNLTLFLMMLILIHDYDYDHDYHYMYHHYHDCGRDHDWSTITIDKMIVSYYGNKGMDGMGDGVIQSSV